MAFKFLTNHTGPASSSAVSLFEIRLENDYIVLRGSEEEASSACLSGQLALCLTDALTITGITLTLTGVVHMKFDINSASSMSGRRVASKDRMFFQKTWTFRKSDKHGPEILQPDNYLWRFETILDGTLPESVEGLQNAHVIYRLKAEIGRKRARDLVQRKPLRIVRTLAPSALELSHAMSVENVWPNKIEYSISTPSKAVVFGSFLQVDFKLIPLLKGLIIGRVSTHVKEEQEIILDPEWGVTTLNNGIIKDERVIAYDLFMLNPEHDLEVIDEAAEGYRFSRYLELPKSLTKCLQDCNVKGIKVRHKIKFNVQLLNPDGHISELRANLPIQLYISESLPLNANNDLIDQTPQAGRAAMENDLSHAAPPLYGEHRLDQLYLDVDYSGYNTPGALGSGPATPYAGLSRRGSHDNITALTGLAPDNDIRVDGTNGELSASALQYRLQSLNLRETARVSADSPSNQVANGLSSGQRSPTQSYGIETNGRHDYSIPQERLPAQSSSSSYQNQLNSFSHTPDQDNISRRTSNEEDHAGATSGTTTPFLPSHLEDLARVPSYGTALKTPPPRSSTDLPSYGATIQAANSLARREAAISSPAQAHTRPVVGHTYTSSGLSNMTRPSRSPLSQTRTQQDEERRLHMLRMRGR